MVFHLARAAFHASRRYIPGYDSVMVIEGINDVKVHRKQFVTKTKTEK